MDLPVIASVALQLDLQMSHAFVLTVLVAAALGGLAERDAIFRPDAREALPYYGM